MKLRKLSVAGLVSALLVGALGIGASAAAAEDGYGTVTGKVTSAGKAVVGASVYLANAAGDFGGFGETDATGTYTMDWATPGTWVPRVSNYSYDVDSGRSVTADYLETYSGNTVREPDAAKVTVTSGGTVKVDVKVVAGATVKGKVVDAKGKPVKGASVSVSNSNRAGYGYAETDSNGSYQITGLATGPVQVWASTGSGSSFRDGQAKVSAVQGKTVTSKTIKLKAQSTGTIKGTVKGLKKNDTVWLYDTKSKFSYQIALASKSKLKINEKVAPGTYRLVVGGQNIASKAVTVKAKKTAKAGTLKASKKRTKVSGTIKSSNGKKLKGAGVSVYDSYGTFAGSAESNKKGKYSISGVVSGKYEVSVNDPSKKNAWTESALTVKKGKNAKKNVKLGKAYTVKGTIKYAGKPVAGVNVYASSGSDVTDANGKFSIKGLGKGKNFLSAYDPFTGGYLNASKTVKIKKNYTWNVTLKK